MSEILERNIQRFPKLRKVETALAIKHSVFLSDVRKMMAVRSLSYDQAVTACRIIDEIFLEAAKIVREERQSTGS